MKILRSENFEIETDLTLIRSGKQGDRAQYSTSYTLLDLDYDAGDVVSRLKELCVEEYSETLVDRDDCHPPLLFVFGKVIRQRQVYIKLKIRGEARHIICVSFHYAENPMLFPYALMRKEEDDG